MDNGFITKLRELGFFKGLSSEEISDCERDLQSLGWAGIFSNSYRLYAADAEDLAEGGITDFVSTISGFLTNEGIQLPRIESDFTPDGYKVAIGNELVEIYGLSDLERDADGTESGLVWGLAAARAFRLVNQLLIAANSPERMYAVNGGNDLYGFFLTEELRRLIMDHPQAVASDGPYIVSEEYPSFGQPE